MQLRVNGQTVEVEVEADMPLLWVVREELGLRGTKFGCGMALCGACTMHIDGVATRTCVFPVQAAVGREITTIEALGTANAPHPVQQAWLDHQVPQCGYCQSGMQMAVAALLESNPRPTRQDLENSVTNICRCGSYQRIREAVDALVAAAGEPEVDAEGTDETGVTEGQP